MQIKWPRHLALRQHLQELLSVAGAPTGAAHRVGTAPAGHREGNTDRSSHWNETATLSACTRGTAGASAAAGAGLWPAALPPAPLKQGKVVAQVTSKQGNRV